MKTYYLLNARAAKVIAAERSANRLGLTNPNTGEIAALTGYPSEWVSEINKTRRAINGKGVKVC